MGCAPHGYRRVNASNYEIDPITSQSVKRIFDLALEGKQVTQISRILTREKYPTPQAYSISHPEEHHVRRSYQSDNRIWSNDTVTNILHNPVYTGTLIMGKSRYNHKKRIPTEIDKQYITENAHPAIISKEIFDLVQEIHPDTRGKHRRRTSADLPPMSIRYPRQAILKGHLKCGYCGKTISIYTSGKKGHCPNSFLNMPSICASTIFLMQPIEDFLLTQIQNVSQKIISTETKCQQQKIKNSQTISALTLQKEYLEKEIEQLTSDKHKNYEAFIHGTHSLAQFQMMAESLQKRNKVKQEALYQLTQNIHTLNEYSIPEELIMLASKATAYINADTLTSEMVDELIQTAIVKDNSISEIVWKHKKLFDEYGLAL